jgi:hypothetical protein
MAHEHQPTADGRFPRRDLFSTNPRPPRPPAWSERRIRNVGADLVRHAEELCVAAVHDPTLVQHAAAPTAARSRPRLRDRTLVAVAVLSWLAALAALIVGVYPLAGVAVVAHVVAITTLVLRDPVP